MSNRVYDILKWLCVLCLPALATLIRVVFSIWGIPYGEEISATIVAINAFLGACLGISSIQYQKGITSDK
jgi:ABC-type transport system involved in multi-copper enzyme maturation permease subunit